MAALRVHRSLRAAVALVIAAAVSGILASPAAALPPPPTGGGDQWIAKQFSETLGRAPDSSGWGFYVGQVDGSLCNATSLKNAGTGFFSSAEFSGLGYNNAAKVVALYRAILNRDPDPSGFAGYKSALDSGTPITTLAGYIYGSSEFSNLSTLICRGGPYYWGNQAYFTNANDTTAYGHISDGQFAGGTAAQLQTALNNAAGSCGTVYLDRGAVVTADTTITIPACVTLATANVSNRNAYLTMGRIIRTANFVAPVIRMQSNSKLNYVWVDGNRNQWLTTTSIAGVYDYVPQYSGSPTSCGSGASYPSDADRDCMRNISVDGSGVTISNNRIMDPLGGTNIKVVTGIGQVSITGNLITSYATSHYKGENGSDNLWADGVSFDGNNSSITNNQIIDATDVGVVLFPGSGSSPNVNTSVSGNQFLQAGNSAFAAANFDPLPGSPPTTYSYTGSSINSNTLWDSKGAHYHVVFSLGSRAWFGPNGNIAANGAVQNNTVPSGRNTRSVLGVSVDAMTGATVSGNSLAMSAFANWTACGIVQTAQNTIDLSDSTGSISPAPLNRPVHSGGCWLMQGAIKQSQESLY